MDLTITHHPHLDGTLTIWSVGNNWGFTFDNSYQHKMSPYRVLLLHGLRRCNRQIMSSVRMPSSMIKKLDKAEETEQYAPSVLIANVALCSDFPIFAINDAEIEALKAKVEPHLQSIPTRLTLEKGPLNGPLADLSEEDSQWLIDNNADLVFSDAGIPFEDDGTPSRIGAWAFYSTRVGLSSGTCEFDDPASGKAEIFAAEAALLAHEGHMLLIVDSHETRIAIEGKTQRSRFLNQAYQEGRLRVTQVKGHAGCVGNEIVDQAAREINNQRRQLTKRVHQAEAAMRQRPIKRRAN